MSLFTFLGLGVAALLVAANGVFVAVEFALVAVDRIRIEQLAAEGKRAARIALVLLKSLSFQLSGAQFGITVTSLVLGFIARPAIAQALEPLVDNFVAGGAVGLSIAAALVIAVMVQMVLGELVPKTLAIARPLATSLRLAVPMRAFSVAAGPVIRLFDGSANKMVAWLGFQPTEELSEGRSREELEWLFRLSGREGALHPTSARLLTRAIGFAERDAADVLVPRVSVCTIDRKQSVADMVVLSGRTGFSRFPVIGSDIDDVVGVASVKYVYRVQEVERATTPVVTIMQPPLVVPETRDLRSLLLDMRAQRSPLAVVLDEHGGTAGIVTQEDLVEEIVGEISDEHDEVEPPAVARYAGELVVQAGIHPHELEDMVGLEVPEGEYETLAGFILGYLQRIPIAGEVFRFEGWEFEIQAVDRNRIDTVLLRPPETPKASTEMHLSRQTQMTQEGS
ncbi:MAG: HlyC/CorC family transporter [Acidimicrobiia bacterium]|nr:HlyC/CorC family transporter [Acidimicrobiia bacterium]MYC57290.1 HlyC/CorC family transporter [Acidimicrobiia bacterium]MYG94493.1 HlyC/CorC family transporter [Acidimicrobiia bacterium]MYI30991.1 HlyC/CorC family transporter [Acidimicrobiia bacterium]